VRVALVTPHFPPRYVGGVESHSERLARQLRDRGHDCFVACAEQVDAAEAAGVESIAQPSDGLPVERLVVRWPRGKNYWLLSDHTPLTAWFEQWLRRCRADLLHVQSGYLLGASAMTAAARLGVPQVVLLHDYWFVCPRITLRQPTGIVCSGPETPRKCAWCLAADQRGLGRLVRPWLDSGLATRLPPLLAHPWLTATAGDVASRQRQVQALLSSAAVRLAPSRFLRDLVTRTLDVGDVGLLPLGVPPAPVVAEAPRTAASSRLRVGFVGQVSAHKGVHVLVEAITRLNDPRVSCEIHGDLTRDPAYADRLRRLASGTPGVTFAGPYAHSRVYDILGALDVVVVPSVWYENRPFVILEAQAAGRPVVTSRLGGMAELVMHERDGLLFEPGNAADLARQLARLADVPALLATLRRGIVPPPTTDEEFDQLLRAYARALGVRGATPQASSPGDGGGR
jgi:glycosyltransferase involved in cell wall biosynthesis